MLSHLDRTSSYLFWVAIRYFTLSPRQTHEGHLRSPRHPAETCWHIHMAWDKNPCRKAFAHPQLGDVSPAECEMLPKSICPQTMAWLHGVFEDERYMVYVSSGVFRVAHSGIWKCRPWVLPAIGGPGRSPSMVRQDCKSQPHCGCRDVPASVHSVPMIMS